ncbi:MAG: hypothetical protein OEV36_02770 [Myxococcales bacterium]|nr:hypothetical protein [Myxococcales bacterium]
MTKPLGITARIQSVQYGAAYIGAMFAGVLGGRISESRHTEAAFMICAMLMAWQWWIIFRWMREAPLPSTAASMGPDIRGSFRRTIRSRASVTVAILLAIFHLNPFTQCAALATWLGAIVTGACWAVFPKVPWRELAGVSQAPTLSR